MAHHRLVTAIAASVACLCAAIPQLAHAQSAGEANAPNAPASSHENATPTPTQTATPAVDPAASNATAVTQGETRYVARLQSRYPSLATQADLESLVHGLRTGTTITLTGGSATQSTTFSSPTAPMGYGNITRALTIARQQLAAAGISDPSPQQLQTALTGGTVTTAQGSTEMQGVLQLRSQGMGWGQIARTVSVHPGMGTQARAGAAAETPGPESTSGGATYAGRGTAASSASSKHEAARTAGRGIVTGAGTSAPTPRTQGQGAQSRGGGTIVTAAGGTAGHGSAHAQGRGNGARKAHGGKN
jgi:hypothetical protein